MSKARPVNPRPDEDVPISSEVPAPTGGDVEPEEIERLAHQYWQERGCPIGTSEEDWFRAEEEIKLRQRQPAQEGDAHLRTS